MKIEIANIKCIIWDLDDTFWKGTLSSNLNVGGAEHSVEVIKENIDFITQITEYGFINSICSKNDEEKVVDEFEREKWKGVWNYFVFNSINWSPKGQRIKNQIENMQLRADNVLFIDDNPSNLAEVRFYCPNIMTAGPDIIDELVQQFDEYKKGHKRKNRLNQYRILERKKGEMEEYDTNENFLRNSNICIQIVNDCENFAERISELIQRTNQLNYTKKRSTSQEINELLADSSILKGLIKVSDDYGDYGFSGFYAIKDKSLIHFLFSCRIMGMGVEQYVYSKLDYPDLKVEGDVAYSVEKHGCPDWIRETTDIISNETQVLDKKSGKILVKGPCDLTQTFVYLNYSGTIDTEVIYVNEENGITMEAYNHSSQIVEALTIDSTQKSLLINELPFVDELSFSSRIFQQGYDVVFYSILTDPNLGLYQRKTTGEIVAFGEWCYDMTDSKNWELYQTGKIFTANFHPTLDFLKMFSQRYEYIGRISIDETVRNIRAIREHIPSETILCLFCGSEIPYEKNQQKAFVNRDQIHKELNQKLLLLAQETNNIRIINFTDYVRNQKDYFNNINHLKKAVYYEVAKDISSLLKECTKEENINIESEARMLEDSKQQRKKRIKQILMKNYVVAFLWKKLKNL